MLYPPCRLNEIGLPGYSPIGALPHGERLIFLYTAAWDRDPVFIENVRSRERGGRLFHRGCFRATERTNPVMHASIPEAPSAGLRRTQGEEHG
jgi:hypothetical protein